MSADAPTPRRRCVSNLRSGNLADHRTHPATGRQAIRRNRNEQPWDDRSGGHGGAPGRASAQGDRHPRWDDRSGGHGGAPASGRPDQGSELRSGGGGRPRSPAVDGVRRAEQYRQDLSRHPDLRVAPRLRRLPEVSSAAPLSLWNLPSSVCHRPQKSGSGKAHIEQSPATNGGKAEHRGSPVQAVGSSEGPPRSNGIELQRSERLRSRVDNRAATLLRYRVRVGGDTTSPTARCGRSR